MSSRYSILLLALLAASCSPARHLTESHLRDSVYVHRIDSVIVRDTVVFAQIPAESGANILPETDTSFLQTSVAESQAFVKDGRLYHTLRNRSEALLPVKVQYFDRVRSEKVAQIAWHDAVETVEVKKQLSRWQNFIMTLGYAVLIAAVAWLAWKLSKIVRTFL